MKRLRIFYEAQDQDVPKGERLERAILEAISKKVFLSGEPLPTQRSIADELNIALGTVTSVCNRLRKTGIIYGERGRGSFVAFQERFAHDAGDRFSLDDDYLDTNFNRHKHPELIFCNLVERLEFLNSPLPEEINFAAIESTTHNLRDLGAVYLRQHGIFVNAHDVTLSHNAYIALWTAMRVCCPQGTVLGAPCLSFLPLFRNVLTNANIKLISIDCDQYGILPESLEYSCRNHGLRVLTCSPECELPTTMRMGKQRRLAIAELARKYDLTLIEHNWLLPSDNEPELPALTSLAPERSIFLEHGSKMLSSGNFCSFSYVPQHLREIFVYNRNIVAGPIPLLTRKLTQYWIEKEYARREFNEKNEIIIRRNEIARAILSPLPVMIHNYARFCWLPMCKGLSSSELRKKLAEKGVLIAAAASFQIGSVCKEDGILIGLGFEPEEDRLVKALTLIKHEVLS